MPDCSHRPAGWYGFTLGPPIVRDQQAARRERAVADLLRPAAAARARARAAGCRDRARSDSGAAPRRLAERVATSTISRCSALTSQPLSMKRAASQSSSSGCVGSRPWLPKSSWRRDEAAAEVHPPDPVDGDARGQRVGAARSASAPGRGDCAAGRRETAAGSPACRAARRPAAHRRRRAASRCAGRGSASPPSP